MKPLTVTKSRTSTLRAVKALLTVVDSFTPKERSPGDKKSKTGQAPWMTPGPEYTLLGRVEKGEQWYNWENLQVSPDSPCIPHSLLREMAKTQRAQHHPEEPTVG